jgi:transcriptional regulator with XRE-family HTH domain
MEWESVIGRNLRRFRKARGFTQETLAADVGLEIRQLGRIERGQSFPSVRVLIDLAEVLGVEPGAFFAQAQK